MKQKTDKSLITLKKGGKILYPTDTTWGIGCDATNSEAIEKIYTLKKRNESKSMICLVSDVNMLKKYIKTISPNALNIVKFAIKPTTIIYDNPVNIAKNLIANNNTLAIRVVKQGFAHQLIKAFNKPLVSTSANISGEETPKSFKEISQEILKGVDYIVDLPSENKHSKPSSIIKFSHDGIVKIIRE